MKISRRSFIKSQAVAAAATTAGVSLAGIPVALAESDDDIRWDKIPCRFCGTGCSVLAGTRNGRIVATQGDPDSDVNKGLNCIKGYFLSKIMYGRDRLTTPLLRKTGDNFDKMVSSSRSRGMRRLMSWQTSGRALSRQKGHRELACLVPVNGRYGMVTPRLNL